MEIIQPHPWAHDSLFSKALIYINRMEACSHEEPDFAFWSSLSLEFLARATLSYTNPALLADANNWRNIQYALNLEIKTKNFTPTSIGIKEVLNRIAEINPEFTNEMLGLCSQHVGRRNAELHTGELAFFELKNSTWLPKYYLSCDALLKIMNKNLSDLFSMPNVAEEAIKSLNDDAAKSVRQDINAYKKVWENKSTEDREKAIIQATAWATRQNGHRVSCPSCSSVALVYGTPCSSVKTDINNDQEIVIQKQSMMPSTFECIACGLKISGYSKLSACDLADSFTSTTTSTIAEFYNLYTEDEIDEAKREAEAEASSRYEDDNNE